MRKRRVGKIIVPLGLLVEREERIVAEVFARLGSDIEFLAPSKRSNERMPDIIMGGLRWEIKSPRGKSSRTIENNIRKALLQSNNIILFFGRVKLPEDRCLAETARQAKKTRKIKRLKVVTRGMRIVDIK